MVRPVPQPPCAHPSTRRRPRPTTPSLTTGCAIASSRRWSATPARALRRAHTFPRATTTVTLAVLANAATTTAALATAALASAALATTAL